MISRLLYLLVLLPFGTLSQGRECKDYLEGLVKDGNGTLLTGATVHLENTGKAVASNERGHFKISDLCSGNYTLVISFVGYNDYYKKIKVPSEEVHEIILIESSMLLQDVKIAGASRATSSQTSSFLSERDFDLTQGKSLGESLKKLPGISALQTGPAIFKPIIHGLHSQRILILNNGIRQEGQQWGPEHAPEIDPFIANEIQVIKGAETVRYGADAMGGVIIIDTPPLHQTDGLGGEVNIMGMSNSRMGVFSSMLEGDFGGSENWAWRLQGTAKRGGDFRAANYNLSNTGVEEFNMSAALGYKADDKGFELYLSSFNSEIGILRSAHSGSLSDLDQAINSERPWFVRDFTYDIDNPKQKIGHHLLKINSYKYLNNNKLDLQYGLQLNERKEFDIRRGGRSDIPALSLQLFTQTLDAALDHETGVSDGTIGLNLTYKNNSNVPGTGIRPLIPNYEQVNAGIFLIEHFEKSNWKYELGLRYDYQFLLVRVFDNANELYRPSFNFNYFSGSVGAHRRLSSNAAFNTHLGWSARPPHVSELFSEGLHHGTASIEEGLMRPQGDLLTNSEFIKNERSLKWIGTYHLTSKKISAELSAYVNYIDNYIYLRPSTTRLTIRGAFPVFQYTQTQALLSGADLTLNADMSKNLSYTGKFAYVHGNDLSTNDVLVFLPPAQFENVLTYNFSLSGKVSDLFVSLIVPTNLRQYRAPQVITPAEVRDYDGTALFDFAPAPSSFTLLNIESGFKMDVGKHKMSVIFSAENITNESYRIYMNRLRYFADDVGRNFIIKLKYDFHAHD